MASGKPKVAIDVSRSPFLSARSSLIISFFCFLLSLSHFLTLAYLTSDHTPHGAPLDHD